MCVDRRTGRKGKRRGTAPGAAGMRVEGSPRHSASSWARSRVTEIDRIFGSLVHKTHKLHISLTCKKYRNTYDIQDMAISNQEQHKSDICCLAIVAWKPVVCINPSNH